MIALGRARAAARSRLSFAFAASLALHALAVVAVLTLGNLQQWLLQPFREPPVPPQIVTIEHRDPSKIARPHDVPAPDVPPLVPTPRPIVTPPPELAKIDRNAPGTRAPTPFPKKAAHRSGFDRASRLAQLSSSQAERVRRELTGGPVEDESQIVSSVGRDFDAAVQRRYATVAARAGGGAGVFGGLCYPIKSWTFAGYSYYSESCRLVHADGIVRDVPLPWAVRYTAGDDPFAGTAPQDENLPLPLPPPNWKPSAGQEIDPDIAELLRENGYHI